SLLDGGTIQITGTIGDQTYNIGSAYTILADNLNTDVTMTVDAADIEGNDSFVEDASITFSADVTDKAGNSTSGTAGDAILVVDQFKPVDLGIDAIGVRVILGQTVAVPGYLNTTNDIILIDVAFDGTDNSLYNTGTAEGGTIEVFARPEGQAIWVGISGGAQDISTTDKDANKKEFSIQKTVLFDADGDGNDPGFEDIDTENVKVEFQAQVTDLAGNMTEQEISEHTMLVDEVLISEVVLSYEPAFVNGTATGVIVTATMLEPTHGWNNTNELDLEDEQKLDDILHINIDYAGEITLDVDAPMVPLGLEEFTDEDDDGVYDDGELFTDLDGDGVWDAGDSTVWTYTFDIPDDEDNAGSPPFWVVGTDRAGNPITGITGDPETEVQENTTGLVIDMVDPEITFTYDNTTTGSANLGTAGDVILVVATWVDENIEENLTEDNIPQVTATFSDATTDVQDNTGFESATVWNYRFTLPEDPASDGSVTFSSSGSDAAQNS
ncbi:uncharacterized protein METZ01_LOCUS226715, partial [marine metagenome]